MLDQKNQPKIEEQFYKVTLRNKLLGTGVGLLFIILLSYLNLDLPPTFDLVKGRSILVVAYLIIISFSILEYYLRERKSFTLWLRRVEISLGTILLSFFIHFFGRINGPFVFIYSFIIIGVAYNLETVFPFVIAGIGIISVILEFIFLIKTGEIIFSFLYLFEFALRVIFLAFIASYSVYLVKAIDLEKRDREKIDKLYKKLKSSYQKLKRVDKIKDNFIQTISHQLRTPLTLIRGYSEMLTEDNKKIKALDPEQKEFIYLLNQGVIRISKLTTEIIYASSIEARKFGINPSPTDIVSLIEEQVKHFIPLAKSKGLYLVFKKPKEKIKIIADKEKLDRVILNFIENAINYTEKGIITVSLKTGDKYVLFTVSDSGIGVKNKDKEYLFTKFYRADEARRLKPDGTGLGLYLAKEIIKRHKGEMVFESKENKGSVFGFKTPISPIIKNKKI